jgi:hypothetical protein
MTPPVCSCQLSISPEDTENAKADDFYFLYDIVKKIGICNLTGELRNGIVEYIGRAEVEMTEDKKAREQLRLTSLSHGAG